jgi:hypothetical protein
MLNTPAAGKPNRAKPASLHNPSRSSPRAKHDSLARTMQQQHAAVPQIWSFTLLDGEMAVNVCAPSLCKCPGKRLDDNLDRIKRTHLHRIG